MRSLSRIIFSCLILAFLNRLWAIMSTRTHSIGEKIPKLARATLEELSTGLDARYFTSCQLIQAYTRRIAEVTN